MKKILIAAGVIALAGCSAGGTLLPQEDGTYISRATGYTADSALQTTLGRAEETCTKTGNRFVIIDQHSRYIGPYGTEQARDMYNAAASGAAAARGTFYLPVTSPSDYVTAVQFKCVDK